MASAIANVVVKAVAKTRVIGLRQVVDNYQSQGPLWARVMEFTHAHDIARQPESGACFAIFYDPGFKAQDVDTEVCLPISEDAVVPEDTKEFKMYWSPELPRAATFVHKGAYNDLPAVYNEVFGWIGANQEQVCGPVREIYHVAMDSIDGDATKLVTEIIVPLA